MAAHRKAEVLSGLDVVKTLKPGRVSPSQKPPPKPAPPAVRPLVRRKGPALGRTVMPSLREIACPDCGWESQVKGRPTYAVCPRCRIKIDVVDYTIDTAFTGSIRTAGTVRLREASIVQDGEIRAAIVELSGRIQGGRVTAWTRLDIMARVDCEPACIRFRDLRLTAEGAVAFREPVVCRTLDVAGRLRGRMSVAGRVTVRSGGCLQGDVECPALVVEEGGGLKAEVRSGAAAHGRSPEQNNEHRNV